MARTSAILVQGIIEADTDISLTPFITTANLLVTRRCTGGTMTDEELKWLETYLAAHFYALYECQLLKTKTGQSEDTFESKVGLGLDYTRFGQQAKILDATGGLINVGKMKAGGFHVGIDCCERDL